MAINWNVEKCKNYKKLVKDNEWVLTNSLIWGGFSIGYGQITNKNWKIINVFRNSTMRTLN